MDFLDGKVRTNKICVWFIIPFIVYVTAQIIMHAEFIETS